jgi:transglutaminase-like putative cysteine protease
MSGASPARFLGVARRGSPSRGLAAPELGAGQIRWLAALVIATQAPHLPSLPGWVTLLGASLVALRLLLLRRDALRHAASLTKIPTWTLGVAALLTAGAIHLSFGYFLGRESCVAFLFVLVAIKFLEVRTARDGALLVCLASFLLVTPFFYSQSPLAALVALPALLLVGATLEALARPGGREAAVASWKAPVLRSTRLLLQGIPLAAALFVLFPRLAVPLWGLPTDHAARSGLSETMAPGMISELSLSDVVAFRVDFEGPVPPPSQRYWRGPVLSRFDGREWRLAQHRVPGTYTPADTGSIAYTVTLEPNYKPWLFALDLPSRPPTLASLGDGAGGARRSELATLTRNQQLVTRDLVVQALRYREVSTLRDRFPADSSLDAPENLRLPKSARFGNPRTLDFARELREKHSDAADYVRAVLAWFTAEPFVYTLSPPELDQDPVDAFLFDIRRGFCEHYASAFVVLLRAGGIPARVVTGYQGGEMNPRGGYMIVRHSDAHAWAEALIDGQWRRYDPTAAVAPNRIEIGLGGALPASEQVPLLARLDVGWIKGLQLAWDAVNHDWRRQIVGFNYERQRQLWRDWRFDRLAPWQYATLVVAIGAAWFGLLFAWLAWRRRQRDRAFARWHAFCARLARAGLPRLPFEGPLAYAERAAARWPEFASALRLAAVSYAALRYGVVASRADDDRDRAAALAQFERALAAVPRTAALRAQAART